MNIASDLFCFFAGAVFTNAVPHFVRGVCGQRFPTPFAKPPGRGLSSPRTNVLWACANLAIGTILVLSAAPLNTHPRESIVFLGAGILAAGMATARIFDGVLDQADQPR